MQERAALRRQPNYVPLGSSVHAVSHLVAWHRVFAGATALIGTMDQVTDTLHAPSPVGFPQIHLLFGSMLALSVLAKVRWATNNDTPLCAATIDATQRLMKRWIYLLLYGLALVKEITLLSMNHGSTDAFDDFRIVIVYGILSILLTYVALKFGIKSPPDRSTPTLISITQSRFPKHS